MCKLLLYAIVIINCNGLLLRRKSSLTASEWTSLANKNLQEFNQVSASLTWDMMTKDVNTTMVDLGTEIGTRKTIWKNIICDVGSSIHFGNHQQRRMYKLLCQGPRYSKNEARQLSQLMDKLSEAYSGAEVCIPENSWPTVGLQLKHINGKVCLKGEPDLERLMMRRNLTPSQLQWVWKSWHDAVGPQVKKYYPQLVQLLNWASVNNGYEDIGEVWREELEVPNLEILVKSLYREIEPLYVMLHAVVRHALFQKYGPEIINVNGPIPVHLLGNMWGQDWSALIDLLIPQEKTLKLNEHIAERNWTVRDMVSLAEDMYVSLRLPKMTEKFWKYSQFEKYENGSSACHGTAANMFTEDDYRILLCAKTNMEDFYVIHHEMGHIEYYMSYKNQPAIFQDGANSALQESIGDSIMTGVMAPQHLHRLGLITDEELLQKDLDNVLLLQQALAKIPQIPYALLVDLYRWDIFRGKIQPEFYNSVFWEMNRKLRGIIPPEPRNEDQFDAGAKFHIPDNTPYIRYFLSAVLQMEMFKGMCILTINGKFSGNNDKEIPFPLHRCDIYGSRNAGIKLRKMMSLGASEHWSKSLKILTGKSYISAKPLLEYYNPIYKWLQNYIISYNVSVGW